MNKEVYQKFEVMKKVRISKSLDDLVKMKALESHSTESEVIRAAIIDYTARMDSDAEIIHSRLEELRRQIKYIERKIVIYPAMFAQMMREMKSVLPLKKIHTDEEVQDSMERFFENTARLAKSHRIGLFEEIALDEYEHDAERE